MIELMGATEQESPRPGIRTGTGNLVALFHESGRKQAKDVKFVCDDLGVREMSVDKILEGIAEIHDGIFDVFSARNMFELAQELTASFALREFKDTLVWVVDDD